LNAAGLRFWNFTLHVKHPYEFRMNHNPCSRGSRLHDRNWSPATNLCRKKKGTEQRKDQPNSTNPREKDRGKRGVNRVNEACDDLDFDSFVHRLLLESLVPVFDMRVRFAAKVEGTGAPFEGDNSQHFQSLDKMEQTTSQEEVDWIGEDGEKLSHNQKVHTLTRSNSCSLPYRKPGHAIKDGAACFSKRHL
ncbi:unnamed protein product, partial [Dovyalis caffra]